MSSIHFLSQNRPGPQMGMGHYERLLIQHLGRVARADDAGDWHFEMTFAGRKPDVPQGVAALDPALARADFLGYATARLAKAPLSAAQILLNLRFAGRKPDLYHALALSFPLPTVAPGVYTLHDLAPLKFPDEGQLAPWVGRATRNARFVITPSECSKSEIIALLGLPAEKIIVIPYGCEHDRYHPEVAPADKEQLKSWGIEGDFLLYAGGFTQRKNVPALLEAWKSVASHYPDLTLVLAGPQDKLRALAVQADAPRVLPMGYVAHGQMPHLMKAARALLFPTLYEGFGLPPQEAMALGVPVLVCAQSQATLEVVGDAGVIAPDGSAGAIADALRELLDDQDLQARLKLAGPKRVARFDWDAHARAMLDVYGRALE